MAQKKITLVSKQTLMKACKSIYACKTIFNDDGSIIEAGDGWTKKTVFNDDGSITETYEYLDPESGTNKTVTKTTAFNNDGTIASTIS